MKVPDGGHAEDMRRGRYYYTDDSLHPICCTQIQFLCMRFTDIFFFFFNLKTRMTGSRRSKTRSKRQNGGKER